MIRLILRLVVGFTAVILLLLGGGLWIGQQLPRPAWDQMAYIKAEGRQFLPRLMLIDFPHRLSVDLSPAGDLAYTMPHWSPDGRHLVARTVDYRQTSFRIDIFDPDRRNARILTSRNELYLAPKWSPDGRWIACSVTLPMINNSYALYVFPVDAISPDPVYLTNYTIPSGFWGAEANSSAVTWSRDSQSLMISASESAVNAVDPLFYTTGLYEIPLTGGELQPIRDDVQNIIAPALSPDGQQIVFISNWDTNILRLYVMNRDGSVMRRLEDLYFETLPAWSPDGESIGYWLRERSANQFYTIDLKTGEKHLMVEFAGQMAFPAWRP